jgi:hypothetical protein
VSVVCTIYHIMDRAITLGGDNLSEVNQSNTDWQKVNKVQRMLTLTWGHSGGLKTACQSRRGSSTLRATKKMTHCQSRIAMDTNAKDRLWALIASPSTPVWPANLCHEGWQCWINGPGRITHLICIWKMLMSAFEWTKALCSITFQDVDWAHLNE